MKETRPFRQLFRPIPAADDVLHGRIKCGLSETYTENSNIHIKHRKCLITLTDKKPNGYKMTEVLGCGEQHSQNAPDQLHCRNLENG
jgi:hypothetical protein